MQCTDTADRKQNQFKMEISRVLLELKSVSVGSLFSRFLIIFNPIVGTWQPLIIQLPSKSINRMESNLSYTSNRCDFFLHCRVMI